MTGAQLRAIREKMGLERLELARLVGYTGSERNDITRVKQMERDYRQVPLTIARLVWLLSAHQRRTGILPVFPEWPGYDFESVPDAHHQVKP